MPRPKPHTRYTAFHDTEVLIVGTIHNVYDMHDEIAEAFESFDPEAIMLESAAGNAASSESVGHRAAKHYKALSGCQLHVLRGTPYDIMGTLGQAAKERIDEAYRQTNSMNMSEEELDQHAENLREHASEYYTRVIAGRNAEFAVHAMSLIEQQGYGRVAIVVGKDHVPQLEDLISR